MSIERELLKKVISGDNKGDFFISYDMYKEIKEFLAKPEQEPVAWMQDSIELYVLEEKSAIRGYVIPLYTAPPEQKPLTPRQGLEEYKRGYAQAELDLKREPLGLEIMDVCGSEDYEKGYEAGRRVVYGEAVDTQPEVAEDDYNTGFKAGSYKANMVELRDAFAGLAMQKLIDSYDCPVTERSIAREAYGYADAMLKVRDKAT